MSNIFTVKMPDIGEGVVEGEVVEWLKEVNDSLKQDEPVVVVMTDKATVELPAPMPGKLSRKYFEAGQIAVKDQPLYDIQLEQNVSTVTSIAEKTIPEKKLKKEKIPSSTPCPFKDDDLFKQKGLATPPIRHLAKTLKIDLSTIQGTGKEGRITIEDLQNKHQGKKSTVQIASVEGDEERPLIGVRRLMAEKMKASKEHIPHFSYFEKVEASRLVSLRNKVKAQGEGEGISVTYMPFFMRALSLCIKKYPEINASLNESTNKLIIHHHQHIGVAIAGPQGLVVAVVHDVQDLSLEALIRQYEDLKKRALNGQLHSHETKNSTITISNFGVLGGAGLWATPIINYPESAILAVDRIQKQPIAYNEEVVVRDVLNVSWSFDHRFIDGELAAAVSRDFCGYIKNPATLL